MIPLEQNHERLLRRNVEDDTRILTTKYLQLTGIPVLLEEWTWEGVSGSTAIFLTDHVASMDDTALQRFLTEQAGLDLGATTIVRQKEHVFLNFGFAAT